MDPEVLGANFNIASTDMPNRYTFEEYVDMSIPGIKTQITVIGNIDIEYINLNGNKAAKIEYIGKAKRGNAKLTQIVVLKYNKIYILTLTALEKDLDIIQPKFDKIIKSLK